MPTIYKYKKVTDKFTTHSLAGPDDPEREEQITELCTINGMTYVSVPDGITLPNQSSQVSGTLNTVLVSGELRKQIKDSSPHVRLINSRVVERIRQKYSLTEELKMQRLTPSDESTIYYNYVEECRAWGETKKAKLGL